MADKQVKKLRVSNGKAMSYTSGVTWENGEIVIRVKMRDGREYNENGTPLLLSGSATQIAVLAVDGLGNPIAIRGGLNLYESGIPSDEKAQWAAKVKAAGKPVTLPETTVTAAKDGQPNPLNVRQAGQAQPPAAR